jgi:hypothetical protein
MTSTFDRLNQANRSGDVVRYSPDKALQQVTYGQPQTQRINSAGALSASTRLLIADTSAAPFAVELAPLQSFEDGEKLELVFAESSAGILTVNQNAGDPPGIIAGFDTVIMSPDDTLVLQRIDDLWKPVFGSLSGSGSTATFGSTPVVAETSVSASFNQAFSASPGTVVADPSWVELTSTPTQLTFAVGTGEYTVESGGAGDYLIRADLGILNSSGGALSLELNLFVNGGLVGNRGQVTVDMLIGEQLQLVIEELMTLAVGDTVSVALGEAGAGTVDVQTGTLILDRR